MQPGRTEAEALFQERMARIRKAVALERPDRVPVVLEYAGFAARVTGTPMPEFLLDLGRSVEVMIQAYRKVTEGLEADGVNYGRFSPFALSYLWLSKVKVPGLHLPQTASYQVVEQELMSREDYDRILQEGWPRFLEAFMRERVLEDVDPRFLPGNQRPVDVVGKWAALGVPVLRSYTVAPPFEFLSGARSLECFFMDLLEIPQKVEQVMEAMMGHMAELPCRQSLKKGYPAIWVGGWRGAPSLLSPQMWERFVWRYFRKLVQHVIEAGLIPLLHLDGCWDRELARFRELPKAKLIMALDGHTDIFRAKELLGDHLCLMGDVPASMLAFDSPETVYSYCSRLVREVGPEGFILHSGCDIPENAKPENVRAMLAASVVSGTR
jgi:hypothetical protein